MSSKRRVRLAAVGDVAEGEGRVIETQGKELALFNVDGTYYVIDNMCAHRGGPLGEGELEGCLLTCPWHAWQFDVRTGDSVTDDSKVAVYECKVEGDQVLVAV